MKFNFLATLTLVGLILFATGCSEEDCIPPGLAANIVGSWTESFTNETVEFAADGTFTDPNDALISGEINGIVLNIKTYTVSGDTLITLTAAEAGGQFLSSDFEVANNACDEIMLSEPFFNISTTLTRN
ncbi:MAG: hypothetical protein AAF705_17785 [Bacteroidota bacterium]